MNLASVLTESAGRNGDAVAIKLDDAELTYKALDGASAHVAGLLRSKGVEPGDRVGIMLPNVPYFPVVYYGVLRLGAVVVPMNVLLKGREVSFYLKDPEAKVLLLDEPTSALDEDAKAAVERTLLDLRERLSLSFVFVTHERAQAERLADRVIEL